MAPRQFVIALFTMRLNRLKGQPKLLGFDPPLVHRIARIELKLSRTQRNQSRINPHCVFVELSSFVDSLRNVEADGPSIAEPTVRKCPLPDGAPGEIAMRVVEAHNRPLQAEGPSVGGDSARGGQSSPLFGGIADPIAQNGPNHRQRSRIR